MELYFLSSLSFNSENAPYLNKSVTRTELEHFATRNLAEIVEGNDTKFAGVERKRTVCPKLGPQSSRAVCL